MILGGLYKELTIISLFSHILFIILQDAELRDRFLLAYERRLPVDVVDRFIFLMQKTNWLSFGEYYWLRHAIWFLLRCVPRDS